MHDFNEDYGTLAKRKLDDGRTVYIMPLAYGRARLGIGSTLIPGILSASYDYDSPVVAIAAMTVWEPEKDAEPMGWTRDPGTMRYRINGDSALEYIRHDGTPEERIVSAIAITCGQERMVQEIAPDDDIPSIFPSGTTGYTVLSSSIECNHDPRCKWHDHVYLYLDRIVVVREQEMRLVSLGTIKRRLLAADTEISAT